MKPETLRRIFSVVEDVFDRDESLPERGDHVLNPDLRPTPPYRKAAVLIPIVVRPNGLHVILTRRTAHLNNHAGQISFPGGAADENDSGPVATALREAEEEIGLRSDRVEVLGVLDRYLTRTGFDVTPVVALVHKPAQMQLNPDEVDELFEVPLEHFLDRRNCKTEKRDFMGKSRAFYAYIHQKRYIWGATAGMLVMLREVVEAYSAPGKNRKRCPKRKTTEQKP